MTPEMVLPMVATAMAASAALILLVLALGGKGRVDARIDEMAGRAGAAAGVDASSVRQFARTAIPQMGQVLVPTDEIQRTRLKSRLIHAGFYGSQAMPILLGVKLVLMVGPALVGLAIGSVGLFRVEDAVLVGACFGVAGMIGPSLWLDHRKGKRQVRFRRSLPDALDLLVICLEGGLSLQASIRKIASELRTAHPLLAAELNIVQREAQLGRSPGEALHQMSLRTDLEEVRSLASVLTQSERFGASLAKSLRVHSETLREKRQQKAEEMGQQASTKVLFPTLLFIFPAIFVVILGPAAIQIMETLGTVGR